MHADNKVPQLIAIHSKFTASGVQYFVILLLQKKTYEVEKRVEKEKKKAILMQAVNLSLPLRSYRY